MKKIKNSNEKVEEEEEVGGWNMMKKIKNSK